MSGLLAYLEEAFAGDRPATSQGDLHARAVAARKAMPHVFAAIDGAIASVERERVTADG